MIEGRLVQFLALGPPLTRSRQRGLDGSEVRRHPHEKCAEMGVTRENCRQSRVSDNARLGLAEDKVGAGVADEARQLVFRKPAFRGQAGQGRGSVERNERWDVELEQCSERGRVVGLGFHVHKYIRGPAS